MLNARNRRARESSAITVVVVVSTSQEEQRRRLAEVASMLGSFWPGNRARMGSGAAITRLNAWSWGSVAAWTAERRAASSTESAWRSAPLRGVPSPVRATPRERPGSHREVGLRAVAPLGSFGSVELDHDLLSLGQVSGEAGSMAAGAFDCPKPSGWLVRRPTPPVGRSPRRWPWLISSEPCPIIELIFWMLQGDQEAHATTRVYR